MAALAQTRSAFPTLYDIATVVGTRRATAEIQTGQVLRVDGSRGVVTILDA